MITSKLFISSFLFTLQQVAKLHQIIDFQEDEKNCPPF
jgi:hypothetical protein